MLEYHGLQHVPEAKWGVSPHEATRLDVMAILEMKLDQIKLQRVMKNMFKGLMQVNNFSYHLEGRILILWVHLK